MNKIISLSQNELDKLAKYMRPIQDIDYEFLDEWDSPLLFEHNLEDK